MTRSHSVSALTCGVLMALALLPSSRALIAQTSEAGNDDGLSAEEPEGPWRPPPPMPGDGTWIQLSSGEWLRGEIVRYFRGTLTFDSEVLGEEAIDLDDVRVIRSADSLRVALEDGIVATGQFTLDEEVGLIRGEEDYQFARSELLSITPAILGHASAWSGRINASMTVRSGNTDETDFTARADIERTSPKSRFLADYIGTLNDVDGERTSDSHRATAGWAQMNSRRLFWYPIWAEYYRDPFSNNADRWTLGTGLGYFLKDSGRVEWGLQAGIGYQRTAFDTVAQGDSTSAETATILFGTQYDIEFTPWLDYSFDYRFGLTSEEAGSYNHHIITGLSTDIAGDLGFDISLVWDRIEDPQQNADGTFPERDDFQLLFGLEYSF